MNWTLKSLLEHCNSVSGYIAGCWVPVRPEPPPLTWRIRSALAVLRGKADAFTWPCGQ